MPSLVNARWEIFAQGVAKGIAASVAYAEAGYTARGNSAEVNASRLLKNAQVAARVAELHEEVAREIIIDEVFLRLKLLQNMEKAMQQGRGAVVNRSIELLGKHTGFFDKAKAEALPQPIYSGNVVPYPIDVAGVRQKGRG